ncbi:MAG: ATP-binding protein [Candidatus Marinimicrobia bacterium]|nr:ATP-binding protein [Candidatus Neomarinimicrobiota bacterium]
MSNHGVLTLHFEYINNCKEVLIKITDNGRGIKEKDIDHIFHPFFSSKSTGFGLGLPLSKDIIEAHKGKIAVESKEGKGTTVRIRLPAD